METMPILVAIVGVAVAGALVLLGVAAMLYGAATLYRSVADAKVQQQELELELDSRARAFERFRERKARNRVHNDLLQALIPAATALIGHWLGRLGTPQPEPIVPPCMGFAPKPPTDGDRTIEPSMGDVELDLLVDALGELYLNNWLTTELLNAKVAEQSSTSEDPEHVQA